MWAISMPANTLRFIGYVEYLIRLEFIPKEKILNRIMELVKLKQTEDKQKLYTVLLITVAAAVVLLSLFVVLLVVLFQKSTTVQYYVMYIKRMIFWNTFLRTWVQMYLDLCMMVMLVIVEAFEDKAADIKA